MNTGYTNTVNSITAKDLQEFTKALLEQNNRVEVSMQGKQLKILLSLLQALKKINSQPVAKCCKPWGRKSPTP